MLSAPGNIGGGGGGSMSMYQQSNNSASGPGMRGEQILRDLAGRMSDPGVYCVTVLE
jgi:hypothetical protein